MPPEYGECLETKFTDLIPIFGPLGSSARGPLADPSSVDDSRLDITEGDRTDETPRRTGRPWLMVLFSCSNVYTRVYRDRSGRHYDARCPRCLRTMRIRVGEGGSDQRAFRVHCG